MNLEHTAGPRLRWWQVRMMWLVLGGPAAVVLASLATLGLALHGGDRPLPTGAAAQPAPPGAMTPATQARNHAAAPRP